MKKFVLIAVPTMENAYHNLKNFAAISIPIGITTIAAVLEKEGYEVKIIDADAENLTLDETLECAIREKPDYAGSTCMTATMDIINDFYSRLKERLTKVKVIAGGPHVSALPKRTLEEFKSIDIVVKGEGEDTIVELMAAIENRLDLTAVKGIAFRNNGEIVETENRQPIKDLGRLPTPAYHLLKYDLYRSYMWNNWTSGRRKPFGVISMSRGCYGNCNFCAVKLVSGQKMRYFPNEKIKAEIDMLINRYNVRIIHFGDSVFTANKKLVNEICDYIIEKGYNKRLEINVSDRPDNAHLPTLLKMRKAGVRWICFGVESGNQQILDRMRKNITLQEIRDTFKKSNEAGLYVGGNFMIGNLGETYETVMDTINFACDLEQDFPSFTITIPFPGTEIYQHCIDRGIKLPSWNGFGSVNSHPIPLNSTLNAEQLKELRMLAMNKFFKRPVYLIRMLVRFHTTSVIKDFGKMYIALKKEIKENRFA